MQKTNSHKFIARNIPRRYANIVYSRGEKALDSMDVDSKKWIAPYPIKYDGNLKCYKEIFENAGVHGGESGDFIICIPVSMTKTYK